MGHSTEKSTTDEMLTILLEAYSFGARAHRHQVRKDFETPYFSHPCRVAFIVQYVFRVTDPVTLISAVLHDTIEDTTTDHDDVSEKFGTEVANIVALLSKDKRLTHDDRESQYVASILKADDRVKTIKLADTLDNLIDSRHLTSEQRAKTVAKATHLLRLIEATESASIQEFCEIVRLYV